MAASDDMGGDNVDNSTNCKPLVRDTRQMCPHGDKPPLGGPVAQPALSSATEFLSDRV